MRQTLRDERHFWNGIALFVFIAMCAAAIWLVLRYGTFDPAAIGAFDLVVIGLATFRLIHLLTYDKIFDMVRAAFMDRKGTRLKTAERGWRRLVSEFLACIWCTGMWAALIAVTIYFLGTWGRLTALLIAVAGLGSLLQLVSKALAAQADPD